VACATHADACTKNDDESICWNVWSGLYFTIFCLGGVIFLGLGGLAVCYVHVRVGISIRYVRYGISIRIPIVILSIWVSALGLVGVGAIQGDFTESY